MSEVVAAHSQRFHSRRRSRPVTWLSNPWGRTRFLAVFGWAYMLWAIVPVVIAMQFAFNDGRSRSVWQGFSLRWFWGDPNLSVFHDPALINALEQSLKLAALDMLISVPLGVLLAIGLTRWRGGLSKPAGVLMLFPLIMPELVLASSLLLVFAHLFTFIKLGTTAQVLGQVTFSLSYVVIIVRGRLVSIGGDLEEAAVDLGARPIQALRLVLLPLLYPAIFASTMIVFALSIDDFVVTDYMSSSASTQTIPIEIYSNARGAPTPALNALATLMVLFTLVALALAFIVYRALTRHERGASGEAALSDLAGAGA
jgi:spermidine/putrescine transport system permease protein